MGSHFFRGIPLISVWGRVKSEGGIQRIGKSGKTIEDSRSKEEIEEEGGRGKSGGRKRRKVWCAAGLLFRLWCD